jgi:hypothetical protein
MLRQTRQIIRQIDSQMRQGCRTRSTRLIDINSNLLIQIHITSKRRGQSRIDTLISGDFGINQIQS